MVAGSDVSAVSEGARSTLILQNLLPGLWEMSAN